MRSSPLRPLRPLRQDRTGRLRVVNTGVRLFDAEPLKGGGCAYRVCHEGLPLLLPHLRKQRASCSISSALALLQTDALPPEEVGRDPALAATIASCAAGSVVLQCAAAPDGSERPLHLAAQLAPSGALRPMVSRSAGQRASLLDALLQAAGRVAATSLIESA